ncbi:hypothetical protein GALMADRAFT_210076 [Galerina marginata CBS 339.88]|uniref:Uncharacterized protein n=1 Tax=Galerina marginata (strain CBS 339.88) TaxID=685588 RepID=A0A067TFW5_GALM3|nr:hypothetical protein GALMADRAFT_210076 [Galerina marginata CBS 339.88]
MEKSGGDKTPMQYPKLRQAANKRAQVDLFEKWLEGGKETQPEETEVQEISREEWTGLRYPCQEEIVGGAMYPVCGACHQEKEECLWEFRRVQVRMQQMEVGEPRCIRCDLNGLGCRIGCGLEDKLSKVDDAMGRLVRHAGSEFRKTDRREAEQQAARDALMRSIAGLSGE